MPRQARLDAPGALHHIIIRGIEKRAIFRDDTDEERFLDRFGDVLSDTSTPCYAWALMSNHGHMLLKTGLVPIATVMRRLLTGYAQQFNRRHRRRGPLFDNRYRSILCEEDAYLLELVRYIHLNPIRAGIVKDLKGLRRYRFTGHAVLVAALKPEWQDRDYVLRWFGNSEKEARKAYVSFVAKGLNQGKRPELVGGGLVRSVGGWAALKDFRSKEVRVKGDERILGSSQFVQDVLEKADEQLEQRSFLGRRGADLESLMSKVADHYDVDFEELKTNGKARLLADARAVICYLAARKLNMSGAGLARVLNLSPSTVSKAANRGKRIIQQTEIEPLFI